MAKWYCDALTKAKNAEERRNLRSKTFPGIAKAIAEQYGKVLTDSEKQKTNI